ncbi:hypothetical protein [Fodinibius salsisoli]|uniref:DUF4145 domain-containing protein n=1 Tax=Fodinibius salsisoli TaxID=2820877 RepID=A0ABT3PIN7_9BACT|nr:hypothetical protein [Fodinibius salsisoli]MCW9705799.1 hypothetical protein [Fodinibius salsisoli]
MSEKEDSDRELISFNEFLESIPPTQLREVENISKQKWTRGSGPPTAYNAIQPPDLQLHCESKHCGGKRYFRCEHMSETRVGSKGYTDTFLTYRCDNCKKSFKTYSISIKLFEGEQSGEIFKFGEYPTFGPRIPSRVISLIGPDRQLFLKGRRAENQGLGIGAFSYYRRVVENQKNRIIREIIRVADRIGADDQMIENLKEAEKETQFSKSVELIKDGIPESLLIQGHHNPLTLLHSALSEGLHADTDADCLSYASSIRIVLTDLAEKLSQALKDNQKLKEAVSSLLNKNNNEG